MVGTMMVLDSRKHKVTWDTADAASVEAVRVEFDTLVKGQKALAYSVEGGTGTVIRDFDPSIETIAIHAQMQGA